MIRVGQENSAAAEKNFSAAAHKRRITVPIPYIWTHSHTSFGKTGSV